MPHPPQYLAKTFVLFTLPQILHTVSARNVQQHQGYDQSAHLPNPVASSEDDARSAPANASLASNPYIPAVSFMFRFFVLECKNALWNTRFTSLMMVLLVQEPYHLDLPGSTRVFIFLAVDQGKPFSLTMASICCILQ